MLFYGVDQEGAEHEHLSAELEGSEHNFDELISDFYQDSQGNNLNHETDELNW